MDNYDIVFTTELLNDEVYGDAINAVLKRCRPPSTAPSMTQANPAVSSNRFITTIKPVQDTTDPPLNEGDQGMWMEVASTEVTSGPVTWAVPVCEEGTEGPSDALTQRLHDLADHLPQLGALIDVIWLYKDEVLPDIEESIELYGAVKRLLSWHNAHFTFVYLGQESKVTEDVKDMAEPWVTMLRGHVTCRSDLDVVTTELLWRGSFTIGNANVQKTLQLPGFELRSQITSCDPQLDLESIVDNILIPDSKPRKKKSEPDKSQPCLPRLLASRMAVLAQLDIQEVPLLYFTGRCCHLFLPSASRLVDRSVDFINRLEENKRLCFLVRLNHGTSWRVPEHDKLYKDKDRRERKSWQDLVQDNLEHAFTNPSVPELDGDLGHDHFLLYSDGRSPDGATCVAHLLRRPEQISGDVVHRSVVAALYSCDDSDKDTNRKHTTRDSKSHMSKDNSLSAAEGLLNSLPCASGYSVVDVQASLREAHIKAIQDWIDDQERCGKSAEITVTDLITLLQAVETDICRLLQENSTHQVSAPDREPSKCKQNDPVLPISHLERLVLEYQSTAESRFGRFKSNDSLAGLSPPTKGKVLTLNAAEFLKFFKSDGSSTKENLVEVKVKKGRRQKLMKFDSGEMKSAEWPECGSYRYHGIYYNQSEVESIEARSQRLKSRLQTSETSSTCTVSQVRGPATITVSTVSQGEGHPVTPDHSKVTPERVTRGAVKRKAVEQAIEDDCKKLCAAQKARAISKTEKLSKVTEKAQESATEGLKMSEDDRKQESRSQRHKRKLEEVVKQTLKGHGVGKDNPLFKSCALRLYNITKSFVKDLTTYQSLRLEMERIAQSNVQMIVDFEKQRQARTKAK